MNEAMTAAGVATSCRSPACHRDDSFGVAVYSASVRQRRTTASRWASAWNDAGGGAPEAATSRSACTCSRRGGWTTIDGRLQFAGLLDAGGGELPYVLAGDLNLTGDTPQHRDLPVLARRTTTPTAGRGHPAGQLVHATCRGCGWTTSIGNGLVPVTRPARAFGPPPGHRRRRVGRERRGGSGSRSDSGWSGRTVGARGASPGRGGRP